MHHGGVCRRHLLDELARFVMKSTSIICLEGVARTKMERPHVWLIKHQTFFSRNHDLPVGRPAKLGMGNNVRRFIFIIVSCAILVIVKNPKRVGREEGGRGGAPNKGIWDLRCWVPGSLRFGSICRASRRDWLPMEDLEDIRGALWWATSFQRGAWTLQCS